jgi:hypothetical protein
VLRLKRLTQEELPSLIDHAPPLVKKVIISIPKAVFVEKVVISEPENPIGDARFDSIIDEALSTAAIAPIDESNVVEAAALPPLNRAEAAVASPLQPAHSAVVQAAPILLKTETAVPLPQQPL